MSKKNLLRLLVAYGHSEGKALRIAQAYARHGKAARKWVDMIARQAKPIASLTAITR